MSPKIIKISSARASQLDELREHIPNGHSASYNEMIGALLNIARRAFDLKEEVPGVLVNRIPEGVQIFFEDRPASGLSVEGTLELAKAICTYIDSPVGARIPTHSYDWNFIVEGRGLNVAISVPAKSEPVLFTHDLARDLAGLLESTAKSAPRSTDA
ncbi:hypothetical protein PVW46_11040 [Mameliella sp. AT18]|uniref:hypothetical protein n=1 Tax=Mameliella sp. AT18 TaxID=3028385 RepID=UPI00237BDBB0|nr:hypothetical protein [Mameliella sp. AT18]MDD9730444.1 hypothetical protein [Mameliella sp. AT18]